MRSGALVWRDFWRCVHTESHSDLIAMGHWADAFSKFLLREFRSSESDRRRDRGTHFQVMGALRLCPNTRPRIVPDEPCSTAVKGKAALGPLPNRKRLPANSSSHVQSQLGFVLGAHADLKSQPVRK